MDDIIDGSESGAASEAAGVPVEPAAPAARGAGYLTDTVYTWGFYGDMSPFNINYVAMMSGFAPVPLDREFNYLELGCGNGVSLNVFAACHPTGQFHAVDLNPDHVDNARGLAAGGLLSNVQVHHAAFGDLDVDGFPMFDFIVLHGVYSWVAPGVRREIAAIVERRLKPGGYVFVSYNALPGWSQQMPLRQMMLSSADKTRSSLDRARDGLRYLRFLKEKECRFFASNPKAARTVERLLKQDPRYVPHEFLNEHWYCFYFQEVARELAEAGCGYVGSSPLQLNMRDLAIPRQFHDVFRTAPNRIVFETHKSFVLDEAFRRDIFVRQPARRFPDPLPGYWDRLHFQARPATLDEFRFSGKFPAGQVTYQAPLFRQIAGALIENGPLTPGGLVRALEIAAPEIRRLLFTLHVLVADGQVLASSVPLGEAPPAPAAKQGAAPAAGAPARCRITHAFNRHILKERVTKGVVPLACPATGTALQLSKTDGLLVFALQAAGAHERVDEWLHTFLTARNRPVLQDGKPVEDPAAAKQVLGAALERAGRTLVPKLRRHHLVDAPAPS